MNNETMMLLDKHFDAAFAAPDGIKKLRELILTLAMQGKLVPQDPNDEPASELLKSIEVEKKRLVKEGEIKQPKSLPGVKLEEASCDLPDNWAWVRIRDICHDWGQKTPDKLFTYIDVGSIDNTKGMICDDVQVLEYSEAPSRARKIVRQGTVIYSTVRPYLLNIAIIEQEYSCEPIASTAFAIVHPYKGVINRFIYYYLKSPAFIRFVESTMKGVAYPAINDGDFFRGIFPLPPLVEQHRIVAEIDRLMARCDELEKLRADRSQKLLTVHTAALNALLKAKESSDFSTAWHFITQNFSELYSVKENVAQLRKAILQLAVMGKLVPQDQNEEPSLIQFMYIRQQVSKLVDAKIERKVKFENINVKDEFFLIPENWIWVKLGGLLKSLKYGTSKKCEYNTPGTAVLRIPNINVDLGCIDVEKLKYTNLLESELEDLCLKTDDLLVIRSNGSLSLVGRTAVVSKAEEGLAYAGYLVRLRSFPEYVHSRYLCFALNTVCVRNQIEQPIRSTSGVKNINSIEIANISIPLPPLAEQVRIVAKIDRLMGMCDRLEESIEAAKGKQTDLLNALMSQV
jgi:type I restriction enzyme, S subunit